MMHCSSYIVQVDGGRATDDTKARLFNIVPVTNFGISTFRRIGDLDLVQNKTYFVWIMGIYIHFLLDDSGIKLIW